MKQLCFKVLVFIFFIPVISYSQDEVVFPLRFDNHRGQELQKNTNLRIAAVDTLKLPFFEDFAGYYGNPDPVKWELHGGTFINNNYCIMPPSYNAATFDGLNELGLPYNNSQPDSRGEADKLTSVPIDLSGLEAKDSVYLSFFWQAAGLGSFPDPTVGDHLELYFKDNTDQWYLVWEKEADSTQFYQELISITDKKYLHKSFQFRFQSIGYTSGSFSVWNLDYIYLNKNRSSKDINYPDLAITSAPGPLLKKYTAMPYKQFFSNVAGEAKDEMSFQIFNHYNGSNPLLMNSNAAKGKVCVLIDEFEKEVIDTFNISSFAFAKSYNTVTWKPDYDKLKALNKPLKLKYNIDPFVTDSVLFSANNSIKDSTMLYNYYAYDDGTAEAVFAINDNKGAMSVKYSLNQPDTIVGVYINFQPYETNLTGSRIDIAVWGSVELGTANSNLIASKQVEIKYPENNQFIYYQFDAPIAVSGDFYVGFNQYIKDFVYVGFDLNRPYDDKIYYKKGGAWRTYATDKRDGSLMIRPVFGGSAYPAIVGNVDPKLEGEAVEWFVYPNPSSDIFNISGGVEKVVVTDITGFTVKEVNFNITDEAKSISLSGNKPGVYLMRLSGKNGAIIKRIVLE